jgi:hypothetical protein
MEMESDITFVVDAAKNLRTTVARGIITERMLFEAFERLTADPDYDSHLNELVDLREVEQMLISSESVSRLEDRFAAQMFRSSNRVAIVAVTDLTFGLARMYESLSWKSELIVVTRSLEESDLWLEYGIKME